MSSLLKKSALSIPRQDYFYATVGLIVAILLCAAVGGLGILWLRQQITVTAAGIKEKETQITAFERKIRHLDSRIASVHHPDSLRRRAEALGLQLQAPNAKQVVRLDPTPSQRLNAGNPTYVAGETEPLFVSFDLALMEGALPAPAKKTTRPNAK